MTTSGETDSASQNTPPASSKRRVVPLLALAFGVLAALAGGVGYYTMSASAKQGTGSEGEKQSQAAEPIYVDLAPAFTVNFQDARGPRFLQIAVEVMTRESEAEELLRQHMPMIRSQLVLLFSSQSSGELATREGKEKLIQETLATVQGVLEQETGVKGVEAVYFTSLVMQ
ncbi:MAG: flagellar basal body-associated FliL family protein [Gammaproteobacteria bacterium]|jgi:flagellar FliL protein